MALSQNQRLSGFVEIERPKLPALHADNSITALGATDRLLFLNTGFLKSLIVMRDGSLGLLALPSESCIFE